MSNLLATDQDVRAYLEEQRKPARKAKRILITFSGAAYDNTTEIIVRDAPRFGVDEVRVYDDLWLMMFQYSRDVCGSCDIEFRARQSDHGARPCRQQNRRR